MLSLLSNFGDGLSDAFELLAGLSGQIMFRSTFFFGVRKLNLASYIIVAGAGGGAPVGVVGSFTLRRLR